MKEVAIWVWIGWIKWILWVICLHQGEGDKKVSAMEILLMI